MAAKYKFYLINGNRRTDMKNEQSLPGDDVTDIEPRPTEGKDVFEHCWILSTFLTDFQTIIACTCDLRKIYLVKYIFEVNLGSVRVILLYNLFDLFVTSESLERDRHFVFQTFCFSIEAYLTFSLLIGRFRGW